MYLQVLNNQMKILYPKPKSKPIQYLNLNLKNLCSNLFLYLILNNQVLHLILNNQVLHLKYLNHKTWFLEVLECNNPT